MAVNKFMHPRNIYKNPPDFAKMSNQYPEFSEIVIKDVTGKVSVNFKDPKSLRVLTKYLLKCDFNLDVEIPEDRLVPTLPLRLNYILWIEDLLTSVQRNEHVVGVDIGTGACAIYPLLAAVKNKWRMVATESDVDSLNRAKTNIETNGLQELIIVKHNEASSVIQHLLSTQDSETYDFCMCNPPFYSNMEELCESRSMARPPPKNAFTGSPQELITKGGELEFIRNLIMESKLYKSKILIYTTMVGHKYNLKELLEDLKSEGIQHTYTEFCQGRVTRWGVAWTYQNYDLSKLVPPRDKGRKKCAPVTFPVPPSQDTSNNFDYIVSKLKSILGDLNITYNIINKRGSSLTFIILAKENTWSNQRRKRRLMKRLLVEEFKKPKLEASPSETCEEACDKTKIPVANRDKETGADPESLPNNRKMGSNNSVISKASTCCSGTTETEVMNKSNQCIVRAYTKVFKKESDFIVEMEFLNGTGGKESLHQIAQYIKNKWI